MNSARVVHSGVHMNSADSSRRSFLLSSASLTGAWLAANWPAVASAAEHIHSTVNSETPRRLKLLLPDEAADVEAISAQIVPSGTTPGAREAQAVYFIDRALSSFFSWRAERYRSELADFQSSFRAAHPQAARFAAADAPLQLEYLKSVDHTEFFETTRLLTVLGMFTLPQYGGNFESSGWKMIGFIDQHIFTPPFGYYDERYSGFVPYASQAKT